MAGMRVLQICHKPPYPNRDGGTKAMQALHASLKSQGCHVSLACYSTHKHRASTSELKKKYDEVYISAIDTRIKVFKILTHWFGKQSLHLARFFGKSFDTLLKGIDDISFDLVICDSLYASGGIDPIKSKFPGAKVLVRSHNDEAKVIQDRAQSHSGFQKQFLLREAEKVKKEQLAILNRADGILSISEADSRAFRSHGVKSPLIELGVGVEIRENDSLPVEKNSVGFLGALEWQPNLSGLSWFIEHVWHKVIEHNSDATLHVAGKGSNHFQKVLPVGKNVVFHGEVSSAESFLASKCVLIAPIFEGSGIRIKTIEAVACKRPLVTTTKGVQGVEHFREGCLVTDNADEMAKMLSTLLVDESACQSLVNKSFEMLRSHHDIHQIGARIVSFTKELQHP